MSQVPPQADRGVAVIELLIDVALLLVLYTALLAGAISAMAVAGILGETVMLVWVQR